MLTDKQRADHNAQVVAFWQNKYSRGGYKPLAREFREVEIGLDVFSPDGQRAVRIVRLASQERP